VSEAGHPSLLPTGTVTFLFTDIEGSTRLLQELGEGYGEVQKDHMRLLREAIAEGSGGEEETYALGTLCVQRENGFPQVVRPEDSNPQPSDPLVSPTRTLCAPPTEGNGMRSIRRCRQRTHMPVRSFDSCLGAPEQGKRSCRFGFITGISRNRVPGSSSYRSPGDGTEG
jgi:hypothetical protein